LTQAKLRSTIRIETGRGMEGEERGKGGREGEWEGEKGKERERRKRRKERTKGGEEGDFLNHCSKAN
jgi:hypothetical protein